MNLVTKKILLKLISGVFDSVIFPYAREYVAKTDNSWDDKAIEFLEAIEKYAITRLAE